MWIFKTHWFHVSSYLEFLSLSLSLFISFHSYRLIVNQIALAPQMHIHGKCMSDYTDFTAPREQGGHIASGRKGFQTYLSNSNGPIKVYTFYEKEPLVFPTQASMETYNICWLWGSIITLNLNMPTNRIAEKLWHWNLNWANLNTLSSLSLLEKCQTQWYHSQY